MHELQPDLFGLSVDDLSLSRRSLPVPRAVCNPVLRSGRNDPETSRLAAERLEASGKLGEQQRHALALVKAYPGRTSAELARIASNRGDGPFDAMRTQIARRLGDPTVKGIHVEQRDKRECRERGGLAVTWWEK